ncbi:unnamed protein product [Dovyalis caffra]|uniref:Uncharacterized protein n=1 Tax=Dovyalis caffra TaxID=77055 RepID=A0AAV1S5T1_9ROSI|nr:unnamed protein product [Dovyalis caffra]
MEETAPFCIPACRCATIFMHPRDGESRSKFHELRLVPVYWGAAFFTSLRRVPMACSNLGLGTWLGEDSHKIKVPICKTFVIEPKQLLDHKRVWFAGVSNEYVSVIRERQQVTNWAKKKTERDEPITDGSKKAGGFE